MSTTEPSLRSQVVRVRVTAEELEWVREYAKQTDRTVSNVIRIALKRFYEQQADGS